MVGISIKYSKDGGLATSKIGPKPRGQRLPPDSRLPGGYGFVRGKEWGFSAQLFPVESIVNWPTFVAMKALGIVLIIVGIIGLVQGGLRYNQKDEVARIGDAKLSVTSEKHVTIPWWVGAALVAGGAVVLVLPRRASA